MIPRNEYDTTIETYEECQTYVSVYHTKYPLADQQTDQNFTEWAKVKKTELTTQLSHTYLSTEELPLSLSAAGVRIMINVPT